MFELRSTAFPQGGPIPSRHTCEGDELSPPLEWTDPPGGTKSFALIVDDPDAPDPEKPRIIWVHWLLYNLSAAERMIAEGAGNSPLAAKGQHALTQTDTFGYHGPCPPIGRHRYFFRLFALDRELPSLGATAHRVDLERAMEGHVLGTATLMGTYQKR